MHRFFVDKKNIFEDKGIIIIDDPEDVKHISRVLRLKEDQPIEICDGHNREYIGKISIVDKKEIKVWILENKESVTEPPIGVDLLQGIPKSTKMELIIQKCTELGINRVIPIITERTVVQLKDKKSEDKKVQRWQKIADEASKQSKRSVIPEVSSPLAFNKGIERFYDYDLVMIPYEDEGKKGIKEVLKENNEANKIAIIIGPEGGFQEEEVEIARGRGAIPVSLGPRILRTETAGITALSIVMYELGDLGGN